jgi:hypothetical protein
MPSSSLLANGWCCWSLLFVSSRQIPFEGRQESQQAAGCSEEGVCERRMRPQEMLLLLLSRWREMDVPVRRKCHTGRMRPSHTRLLSLVILCRTRRNFTAQTTNRPTSLYSLLHVKSPDEPPHRTLACSSFSESSMAMLWDLRGRYRM